MKLTLLSNTKDTFVCLGGGDESIIEYTNFDFVGCSDNKKSTTMLIFQFMGGAISQISHLQECIVMSTTKAKYVVASDARKEVVWLSRLASIENQHQGTKEAMGLNLPKSFAFVPIDFPS